MVNAKEAKRLSDSYNKISDTAILKEIDLEIQKAIDVGDYYTYYYQHLPTSVRDKLEELGYKITEIQDRNETNYEINWI